MSDNAHSRNERWFLEVMILSASEKRGIFQVEKVHSSLDEAKDSFAKRLDKERSVIFPESMASRPEEGSLHSFPLGMWDAMDRVVEQVKQQLQALDELKIPKPKL